MKTTDKDYINEYIINKSKFISILCPVHSKKDVTDKLNYYKNIYKGATHYCTAYIIDDYSKYSDNGEPSGTAGVPILNILAKNNLNHILCIVVRYFGGIKLGAGGLIRAYSTSTKEVINISNIVSLHKGYLITIKFNYDHIKSIDNLLKNTILTKKFEDYVYYTFKISEEKLLEINSALKNISTIIKKENTLLQN